MGAGKYIAKGAARGAVSATPFIFRALVWSGRALVTFGAWIVSSRWGRIAGAAVIVLMLLDAAWGSDGVGFPLLGRPPLSRLHPSLAAAHHQPTARLSCRR